LSASASIAPNLATAYTTAAYVSTGFAAIIFIAAAASSPPAYCHLNLTSAKVVSRRRQLLLLQVVPHLAKA
jgi:hypothetical protein